jgi:hypothetical protein
VAGIFGSPADFDPTSGIAEFTPAVSTAPPALKQQDASLYLSKFSSTGDYLWTRTWPMTGVGKSQLCVASDDSGNVYVANGFAGTVDFDPGPGVTSRTAPDRDYTPYISCFSPDGTFKRVIVIELNGVGTLTIGDIKASRGGTVYLTGGFTGTVEFDPGEGIALEHADGYDCSKAFLLKLMPDGSFGWVRAWGENSEFGQHEAIKFGAKVALDAEEDVFVAGEFSGSVDMDPGSGADIHKGQEHRRSVFLSKFGSDGGFQWSRTWGGVWDEQVFGLDVDQSGNACVAGVFKGTVDFDPGIMRDSRSAEKREEVGYVDGDPKRAIRSTIEGSVFLSRFSPVGDHLWTRDWPYLLETYSNFNHRVPVQGGVATDNSGRILVATTFSGTIDIDPGKGTYELTSTGYPGSGYLSVFDSEGKFDSAETEWSFLTGNQLGGIGVDVAGNAFVLDTVQDGGAILTKLPLGDQSALPSDLSTVQPESISSSQGEGSVSTEQSQVPYQGKRTADTGWVVEWGGEAIWGVATDRDGNIYGIGRFGHTMDVDPGEKVDERTAMGYTDMFLVEVGPSGNLLKAFTWGSYKADISGREVVVDSHGDIVLTGGSNATFDIDPGPGFSNLVASNNFENDFVAKIASSGDLAWAIPQVGGSSVVLDPQDNIWTGGAGGGGDYLLDWEISPSGQMLLDGTVREWANWGNGPAPWIPHMVSDNTDYWIGLAEGIRPDATGNLYAAGYFSSKLDFDPGPGVVERAPVGPSDVCLAKYNSSGGLEWVNTWGSTTDWGRELAKVAVDSQGNAYVYGNYDAPMDCDPGPGESILPAYGYKRAYIITFSSSGDFQWAHGWGGDGMDPNTVNEVAFDGSGNVYAVGRFNGTTDFCPGEQVFEVTSTTSGGAYLLKIKPDGTW